MGEGGSLPGPILKDLPQPAGDVATAVVPLFLIGLAVAGSCLTVVPSSSAEVIQFEAGVLAAILSGRDRRLGLRWFLVAAVVWTGIRWGFGQTLFSAIGDALSTACGVTVAVLLHPRFRARSRPSRFSLPWVWERLVMGVSAGVIMLLVDLPLLRLQGTPLGAAGVIELRELIGVTLSFLVVMPVVEEFLGPPAPSDSVGTLVRPHRDILGVVLLIVGACYCTMLSDAHEIGTKLLMVPILCLVAVRLSPGAGLLANLLVGLVYVFGLKGWIGRDLTPVEYRREAILAVQVLLLVQTLGCLRSIVWVEKERGTEGERQSFRSSFLRVLEQMSLFGVVLEPDGRINYCNQPLLEVVGLTLDQMKGRDWFKTVFSGPESERARELFESLASEPSSSLVCHEAEMTVGPGRVLQVRWHVTFVRRPDGALRSIACVGENVTETRLSALRMERHRNLLSAVAASQRLFIESSDPCPAFQTLLDGLCQATGADFVALAIFGPEDGSAVWPGGFQTWSVAGQPDLLDSGRGSLPAFASDAEGALRRFLENRQGQASPLAGRKTTMAETGSWGSLVVPVLCGGAMRAGLVMMVRGRDPAESEKELLESVEVVVAGFLKGLDERRHREESAGALQLSERRLRSYFNLPTLGIAIVNSSMEFLEVNDRFCELMEIERGFLANWSWFQRTHSEDAVSERTLLGDVRDGRAEGYSLEKRMFTDEGRIVPVRVSAQASRSETGAIEFLVLLVEDLSQTRLLEAELRQAQKMEAIGQLAGGVAHDFNNILAATLLHLGLLKSDPGLSASGRETVVELERQANRSASLTRQLLMFSRRSVMQTVPLDLGELLAGLMKMLRRMLGETVQITLQSHGGSCTVNADPGMIEQVMMNLTVNARDAMPGGGQLLVSTRVIELDTATAALVPQRRTGSFVVLSVEDTGCGMEPAVLSRIFEPFFTTKGVGKGTGLGLATVYGIVRQHSGWVEVGSEPGKGTVFRVFLPSVHAVAVESNAPSKESPVPGGTETVLLVEDEAILRNSLGLCLRSLGYRVLEAGSGDEAMQVWSARTHPVHLLLTDMVMPGSLSGFELARTLRAESPGLRVILMSGYSVEMNAALSNGARWFTYLPKPFNPRTLATALRDRLEAPDGTLPPFTPPEPLEP